MLGEPGSAPGIVSRIGRRVKQPSPPRIQNPFARRQHLHMDVASVPVSQSFTDVDSIHHARCEFLTPREVGVQNLFRNRRPACESFRLGHLPAANYIAGRDSIASATAFGRRAGVCESVPVRHVTGWPGKRETRFTTSPSGMSRDSCRRESSANQSVALAPYCPASSATAKAKESPAICRAARMIV